MKQDREDNGGRESRLLRALVRLFPRAFRKRFGDDVLRTLITAHRAAAASGVRGRVAFWLRNVPDLIAGAIRERIRGLGRRHEKKAGMRSSKTAGVSWLDFKLRDVAQDVRLAIRAMRRQPGFATVGVVTLALGIGATTAMFSVLDAVLLRPLPYRAPEQLAVLWTEDPTRSLYEGRSASWNVEQWRCQSQSFADIAVFDNIGVTLAGADGAERIAGAAISPNLLLLLGVRPVQGRSISTEEADERQRLVLLSHRFWQARFGGSSEAIGATIVLDGQPFQIVGILPAGFRIAGFDADVWQSRPMLGDCEAGLGPRGADTQEWFVVGRLRPSVTFDQAQAEMSAIARRLNDQLPAIERTQGISVVPLSLHMVGSRARLALWMLGGAVVCVLLIAAAKDRKSVV